MNQILASAASTEALGFALVVFIGVIVFIGMLTVWGATFTFFRMGDSLAGSVLAVFSLLITWLFVMFIVAVLSGAV